MPWQCNLITIETAQESQPSPGSMWFDDSQLDRQFGLSPQFIANGFGRRSPLVVQLPDGNVWNVDQLAPEKEQGWRVTGEPPLISVDHPVVSEGYEGTIENGILSDDAQGRTYP